MNFQINKSFIETPDYSLHIHKHYEIIFYTNGAGHLRTPQKNYPVECGSIIIVPPYIEHASQSDEGLEIIYVGGDFGQLFHIESIVVLSDNNNHEGRKLCQMIYNNRYGNSDYLSSLCSAYAHFLFRNMTIESNIGSAINSITEKISNNFFDSNLKVSDLLNESGYAEDYIRAHFKRITGKTPNEFLSGIRIKRACFLIETYRDSLSLSQISEQCGYTDYVYFSKKFKSVTGMSPKEYKGTFYPYTDRKNQ